jgi:hypothetical protein
MSGVEPFHLYLIGSIAVVAFNGRSSSAVVLLVLAIMEVAFKRWRRK